MTSIQAHANKLLSIFWAGKSLPVDPAEIARQRGVQVKPLGNPFDSDSGWFRFVDGRPTIFFNQLESSNRQRFTIAHELGHYELGHGERPRDSAAAFNMYNFDPVEVEANRFAAELLMPEASVRWLVDRGQTSLSQLGNAFQVSEVAMKYRLKNLGLLR